MSSDRSTGTWSRRRFLAALTAAGAVTAGAGRVSRAAPDLLPRDGRENVRPTDPDFGDLGRFDEAAVARLDSWLAKQVGAGLAPSLSLAIVRRGDLVYAKAFGLADVETKRLATPRTVYPIASITKIFTATLLMMLVEEGLVSLDDPVVRLLPKGVSISSYPEVGREITLRQLATHTSGLGAIHRPVRAAGGRLDALDAKRLADLLGSAPLHFEPGRGTEYSNLGYGLLGYALGRAAGQEFQELTRARIIEPLKLRDTRFIDTADPRWSATARGYNDGRGSEPCRPMTLERQMAAATGLVSSAPDVARVLAAQLPGGPDTLLTREARSEMRALYRVPDSDGYFAQGIGWEFTPISALGNLPKKGGKSSDGYRSYVVFSPGHDIGVALLFNRHLGVQSGDVARAVLWGAVGAPG